MGFTWDYGTLSSKPWIVQAKLIIPTCLYIFLNSKPIVPRYWGESHVTVDISLLYLRFSLSLSLFQPIFVSSVAISAVLSHYFKAMSLVKIYPNVFPYRASTVWLQLHVGAGMREARVACRAGRGLRPSHFSPKLNTVLQGEESF